MTTLSKYWFPTPTDTNQKPNPIDWRNTEWFIEWAEASIFVDAKNIAAHGAEHIQPNTTETNKNLITIINNDTKFTEDEKQKFLTELNKKNENKKSSHIQSNRITYVALSNLIDTLHPNTSLYHKLRKNSFDTRTRTRRKLQEIIEESDLSLEEQKKLLNQLYKNSTKNRLLKILWKDTTPRIPTNRQLEKIINQQLETEHQN